MPSHAAPGEDQSASDRDQTGSDQDQTWSDSDQTASERDQRTAEEDQHAADNDFAAGGDASTYQRSVLARANSTRDRAAISTMRDETAGARLQTAEDRDRAAALRDRGGDGRDQLARLHDLEDDLGASREDILVRAARDRTRAAADRAKAADDRARAASDREHAAGERGESANLLNLATIDELTGARTLRPGMEEISREIERAHRTGGKLVLAFIDVDDLKALNDSQGHVAGDALLRLIGETLLANIRPYDILVRYGGDELVCVMANLDVAEARERFQKIAAVLASVNVGHSITFGLAEAHRSDSAEDLIARADGELLKTRSPDRD
jgi:diguanylate cyclase (GGDEF)-like protein